MRLSNRLYTVVSTFLYGFENRLFFLQNNFSKMLFILLLGFLTGSMFGSIVSTVQEYSIWDGCIGILLIVFMEIVSYLTYRAQNRPFFFFIISSQKLNQEFWRFANMFKIGLMLGFFVDAFKVGS